MLVIFGSMAILAALAAGWSFFLLRRERGRFAFSQSSLRQVVSRMQSLEEELRFKTAAHESTEEKLRRYLQLMDTLINTMPNPIYFKDSDGVFQGCNKMFSGIILGLTRDRIIGQRSQDLAEVIPTDLAAIYLREELKMIEKPGLHAFEAPVRCADEERRDFLFNLAPVPDDKGTIAGWVAVLADLTNKNRAARVLMQKERLEGCWKWRVRFAMR